MSRDVPDGTDPLLVPLIRATGEAETQEYLEKLLMQHAKPIIRSVIRGMVYRSGGGGAHTQNAQDSQEADDLAGQVNLQLMARLRTLISDHGGSAINSFSAYVAGTAHNVCNTYLRRKWPERYRLKTRVKYVLSHDSRFAVWEEGNTNWVCGLAELKNGGTARISTGCLGRLLSDGEALPTIPLGVKGHDIAGLLDMILRRAGAPVGVDDIVSVAAGVLGVKDQPPGQSSGAREDGALERPQIGTENAIGTAERRLKIEEVWLEIERLPRLQRVALLLGLKDVRGESLLALLSDERVITMRRIAAMLEMDLKEIAGVWGALPLEDVRIGRMVGVDARQVASARLAARRRLARRLKR